MFSTVTLLTMVLYIASCMAVEIIAKDTWLRSHPDTQSIIASNFNSLDNVFLTYVQFVTVDDLASIYVPLIRQRWYLFFYFGALIVLVPVAIMNLVTALLVDKSLEQNEEQADRDKAEIRRLRPHIHKAFIDIDVDGDKILTRNEIRDCINSLPDVLKSIVRKDGLDELLDVLDVDGDGQITEEDFTDGVFQLSLTRDPEIIQDKMLMKRLQQRSDEILKVLTRLEETVLRKSLCTSHSF